MNNPWNAILPPKDDVSARRIDHAHPLDLFWARDFQGSYLFVCEVEFTEKLRKFKLPELVGIQAAFMTIDKKVRLILSLNDKANWEMFFALCNDLVQATRDTTDSFVAVSVIQRRLMRWRDFLKNIRPDILSEQVIKGMIGELLFIKKHLAPVFGFGTAITFWKGPEGGSQDFCVNNVAVEVKCQLGTTQPYVRISSAEQLCSQLPEMYLYVVTLGTARVDQPGSVTLPDLVHDIAENLETEAPQQGERFNDLLFGLGYFESEKYLDYSYVIAEEQMFEVPENFPKIPVTSLRPGIIKVSYDVSLAECELFKKWPKWLES